ncbi:Protein of unknown function DUF137 [Methanocaldococcus vulcanius M7]|uniref:4-phosphopantoate--beta-alanine ligase n=1 Tax=Methanocaldococcus vulcanius (strain ATCC 700851 / DSM 12094 / M7) TaxID=579137 RepID=C9RDS2_METVM|nr:4-phosphopantoate--beta-alanine ligase [Methanocaldococcus vulcanius]ACX73451.1 Protein of unknown function DUF137 [Methanocaldococcus vulcanius M7]
MQVPKTHPRYESLMKREKIIEALDKGILAKAGLIAHGRGEMFDYLIGERTIPPALKAIEAAAATLILSKNPVISVNGNTVALAIEDTVELAKELNGKIEVNLFYRTKERELAIKNVFEEKFGNDIKEGKITILGIDDATEQIPNLDSLRGKVSKEGIFSADVVLVPLEDGDRAEALVNMGKKVIAIDLNPLSRTSKKSTITIVDELTRALPLLIKYVREFKRKNREDLLKIVEDFNNKKNLKETVEYIAERLKKLEFE